MCTEERGVNEAGDCLKLILTGGVVRKVREAELVHCCVEFFLKRWLGLGLEAFFSKGAVGVEVALEFATDVCEEGSEF